MKMSDFFLTVFAIGFGVYMGAFSSELAVLQDCSKTGTHSFHSVLLKKPLVLQCEIVK